MRVLVVPVGSAGDVHPFVGVALALRDRGHEVRVITNPHFAPLLHRVALPLVPFGTTDQFDTLTAHPHLWHQVHGLGVIGAAVGLGIPELYRLVEQEVARGADVVVAGALAFGARIAHETSEFPLVTLHLQPTCFWSLEESPVLAPWLARINSCPRPLKRLVFTLSDQFADRVMAPATNRFRVELGLTPVRHIVSQWWHSPQRVIGLFPDWFASPQPDWPPQTALTGFPLYDERGTAEVPADLDAFLSEAEAVGDPPVVFAPGSGNRQAARFFAAAVDGCRRLGRRGLLLTRYAEQLPSSLPATVRHFDYAPFSSVLPRASALVHHGGIGTAAQALAAGRPHLVMPMTFDQPDNALRLARLGVGRVLRPARFTGAAVARELDALLGSSDVERRCAEIAGRFHGADPRARTCELIEAMR